MSRLRAHSRPQEQNVQKPRCRRRNDMRKLLKFKFMSGFCGHRHEVKWIRPHPVIGVIPGPCLGSTPNSDHGTICGTRFVTATATRKAIILPFILSLWPRFASVEAKLIPRQRLTKKAKSYVMFRI